MTNTSTPNRRIIDSNTLVASKEIDGGQLRRCIAGGPEASSGAGVPIGTPARRKLAAGERRPTPGPQGQGG